MYEKCRIWLWYVITWWMNCNKDKKKERQSSKLEVTSSNLVGAFFTKFQFLTFLLTVSTNKPTFHVDALHRHRVYFLWHFISLCKWFVMSSVLLYMQVHRKTFTTNGTFVFYLLLLDSILWPQLWLKYFVNVRNQSNNLDDNRYLPPGLKGVNSQK